MDFIRQQLVIIQERLRGLSPSQKMLAGTLVVIIAMTMLYWGRLASDREMVALNSAAIDSTEMEAAGNALTAAGITFDTSTGTIRVPADRQFEAINAIAGVIATPNGGGTDALESMLDKLSPLATQGEIKARVGVARNATLKQMLLMNPLVKSAQVQITDATTGTMNPTPAGAVITIATRSGANPRQVANVALATALPMVANLKREGVTVVVDTATLIAAGSNGSSGTGEFLDQKTQYENTSAQDLKSFYSIPGLRVRVTADLNVETKVEKSMTFDLLNKVSLPTETMTDKTSSTDAAPAGEPGAVPNTGLDAGGVVAAPGSTMKSEKNEEHDENMVGHKETETSTPVGLPKIASAMVGVPRSHFVNEWRKVHKNVDPTDDQLADLIKTELAGMKDQLKTKWQVTEDKINVSDYVDYEDPTMLAEGDSGTAAGASASSLSLLAGSHGKEAAIGALALTSLFMVGRMVKKSSPAAVAPLLTLDDMPDVSSTKKARKSGPMGGLDIAGEVAEGGSIMMGQELDEEVLETSQMVEQVSGFVKDNPDTTAQLLRRWMNRE